MYLMHTLYMQLEGNLDDYIFCINFMLSYLCVIKLSEVVIAIYVHSEGNDLYYVHV